MSDTPDSERCPDCDGTGEVCEDCGQSSDDCDCGDSQLVPCEFCNGTGTIND